MVGQFSLIGYLIIEVKKKKWSNKVKYHSSGSDLSLPPTRLDLTQDLFYNGFKGGGGWAWAEARALLDICRSSAHLVQCVLDEPTAGLWLIKYIMWYLLIAWTRPVGDPAKARSHLASNLSLTLRSVLGEEQITLLCVQSPAIALQGIFYFICFRRLNFEGFGYWKKKEIEVKRFFNGLVWLFGFYGICRLFNTKSIFM